MSSKVYLHSECSWKDMHFTQLKNNIIYFEIKQNFDEDD